MFKNKKLFFDFNINSTIFQGNLCKQAKERLLI